MIQSRTASVCFRVAGDGPSFQAEPQNNVQRSPASTAASTYAQHTTPPRRRHHTRLTVLLPTCKLSLLAYRIAPISFRPRNLHARGETSARPGIDSAAPVAHSHSHSRRGHQTPHAIIHHHHHDSIHPPHTPLVRRRDCAADSCAGCRSHRLRLIGLAAAGHCERFPGRARRAPRT